MFNPVPIVTNRLWNAKKKQGNFLGNNYLKVIDVFLNIHILEITIAQLKTSMNEHWNSVVKHVWVC